MTEREKLPIEQFLVLVFINIPVFLRSLYSARIVLAAEMWRDVYFALIFVNVRKHPEEEGKWF
jgi:hypothetical protein